MPRVILVHEDHRILLCEGETRIGRGLHCDVRFNDRAVSREHLRLLVDGSGAVAENLSRSNGTLLNGERLEGTLALADGDRLRVGHRDLTVVIVAAERRQHSRPMTLDLPDEAEPGSGLLLDDELTADEQTLPSGLDEIDLDDFEPAPGSTPSRAFVAELSARQQSCPRCRGALSSFDRSCPGCGFAGAAGLFRSVTQEIDIQKVRTRAAPRRNIEVPVIYSSEYLTFDAVVHDVSRGGMYISTQLLDPVGTPCELTALPEGRPAIRFTAVVAHVSSASSERGRPPGLGVRFTAASKSAKRWVDEVCSRLEDPRGR
jgi:hypothetical protein